MNKLKPTNVSISVLMDDEKENRTEFGRGRSSRGETEQGNVRVLYQPDDAGKIGKKFLVRFEGFHFLVHDGVTID